MYTMLNKAHTPRCVTSLTERTSLSIILRPPLLSLPSFSLSLLCIVEKIVSSMWGCNNRRDVYTKLSFILIRCLCAFCQLQCFLPSIFFSFSLTRSLPNTRTHGKRRKEEGKVLGLKLFFSIGLTRGERTKERNEEGTKEGMEGGRRMQAYMNRVSDRLRRVDKSVNFLLAFFHFLFLWDPSWLDQDHTHSFETVVVEAFSSLIDMYITILPIHPAKDTMKRNVDETSGCVRLDMQVTVVLVCQLTYPTDRSRYN